MKKTISLALAVIFLLLAAPSAFAIEEKYTYDDLQKLYDTVVNYIFNTEDSLGVTLTDEEDALCAKSLNAAKLMLLTSGRSAEEINIAYRGLYSTFSLLMLINQKGQTNMTAERLTLIKSLAAVTLTDDFYSLVDEARGNEVRSISAGAITVINESQTHTQGEVYASVNTLYDLLYSCSLLKVDNYYRYFNALDFADIVPSDWYYDAVGYVYSAGLFKGTSPTEFSPSLTMTRAMFITVLSRFAYAETTLSDSGYSDVSTEEYYSGPVLWARENGILSWVDGDSFYPDAPITRQEMFMCMYNYSRIAGFDDSVYDFSLADNIRDFADAAAIAQDATRWCYSTGVISGYGDNSVKPHSTATRAEVAQVFINFTEVMGAE